MLYSNGNIPLDVVSVVLASGHDSKGRYWEHRLTPASAARWSFAQQYALAHFGHPIKIKAGANAYRDLAWQAIARKDACAQGNCNGASVVGYSSHGGNWGGKDCLAIDVDPGYDAQGHQILSWAQVWEACTAAGFACNRITPQISGRPDGEPWHIIDFWAFGPIPSFANAQPVTTISPEEDDMYAIQLNDTDDSGIIIAPGVPPTSRARQVFLAVAGAYGLTPRTLQQFQYETVVREQWNDASLLAATVAAAVAKSVNPAAPVDAEALAKAVVEAMPHTFVVTAQE